ncbi:hypothetical protein ACJX0J_024554, partial [Zea mays]
EHLRRIGRSMHAGLAEAAGFGVAVYKANFSGFFDETNGFWRILFTTLFFHPIFISKYSFDRHNATTLAPWYSHHKIPKSLFSLIEEYYFVFIHYKKFFLMT